MNLRLVAGATLVVGVTWAAAWALANPNAAPAAALARAMADVAAVTTLGLAVVPALETGRHRRELADCTGPALAVAAAAWLLTELIRQVVAAAQAAALPLTQLSVSATAAFTIRTTPGKAGLLSFVTVALVFAIALIGPRAQPARAVTVGLVAAGIAARAVSGHLSENLLGTVAVTVHALAAALWCGVLAALALTVRHRGQWARILPRFSAVSLVCVAALLISGCVGALLVIDSLADIFVTGYGRILLAKIVSALALVALGWRNRTVWLPAARSHRVTAEVSRRRSVSELAIMFAALTFAAALVVSG
jgi:putative copper resistance protein D